MALDLQYDVVNYTPADASPVEANFQRLEQFMNTEVITRDGVTAMTNQLKLVGDPIAPLDAATKQYVDTFLPIGCMLMFGGVAAPPGGTWGLCDGAELEVAVYPALYAVLGNAYSPAGTPAGRFNLPNLQGRVAVGTGPGYPAGRTGGSADGAVMPHTHPIDHTHALATSFNDFPDHAHLGVDHTHHLNIQSSGQSNNHYHLPNGGGADYLVGGGTPSAGALLKGGSAQPYSGQASTNWAGQDHSHNVAGNTQGADRNLTSFGATARHQHQLQVPTHTGASGAAAGAATSVVDANLPPFVTIAFMMRLL